MVMQLSEEVKGTYCALLFDNSPALIDKHFEDGNYAMGTVRSNRKQIPNLKEDKKMSRDESDFDYSKNIICCKWYSNKPVLLLATNIDGMSGVSNVIRQTKHLFLVLTLSNFTIKNSCLQTWSWKQVLLFLENIYWYHRCRTCKQSYYLHEVW